MESELTCAVCSDIYLQGRRDPVTLPVCGHTFCRQCLLNIERTGSLNCPYCRAKHSGPPVTQLATGYALLNLTKYLRRTKLGACSNHSSTLDFWCWTCHTGMCGFCLFESHCKTNHEVMVMKDALEDEKIEIQKEGSKFLENMDYEKALAMKKVYSFFEGISELCDQAKSLDASVADIKKLMEDAENTFNIETAINFHKKIQQYQSPNTKETEDASSAVLTSKPEASFSTYDAYSPRNNGLSSSHVHASTSQGGPLESTNTTYSADFGRNEDSGFSRERATNGLLAIGIRSPEHLLFRNASIMNGIHYTSNTEEQSISPGGRISSPTNYEAAGGQNSPQDELPYTLLDAGIQGSPTIEEPRSRQNSSASLASEDETDVAGPGRWLSWSALGNNGLMGRLGWEDGRLHLYSLTDENHNEQTTIKLSVIQSLLPNSPVVFLDFGGVDGACFGRVYVKIWGDLRRGEQFLALCTGSLGPSYKGSRCSKVESKDRPGECLRVSHYVNLDGMPASRGLLEGLEWGGEYCAVKKEGLVVSASGGKIEYDGCFDICTKGNPSKKFSCPFGEVVSGLEVVREATCFEPVGDITIRSCGVIVLNSM